MIHPPIAGSGPERLNRPPGSRPPRAHIGPRPNGPRTRGFSTEKTKTAPSSAVSRFLVSDPVAIDSAPAVTFPSRP
ncbi:hypothetical protein TGDOM2_271115 [Toxoplasma gondii GAB2-2007-GAL-DOM2]|uniref:Uncharacterized protein n=8 Tax=Toxoplasma gondii TaxID=5811 RepID=A0A125YHF1_TOXGV|nr:hypothetical protein TGGT1_271115 [Toxoplasma gondii GT1]ESS36170.1 hypothetical protein TGVEG_271115 [Toxoplasma gondii VEG]KAF4642217.1 hypothetical protein TGRH88_080300 [Toxoplasma gondii]KFG43514.1 hypothetical protein TGDOM2_271115 [Toxoplasma gondii GAB2-2007-GAL-DOM2]KFG52018.1 hypothetical protein TGP89_271115 [Toxoplasma gondii p89]KFG54298.1 hypothetical protein TGFOU_271115 [Toxoplasma gondii FOU]KFH16588.1 hypothetical protein TGMAS_271115 [Toxoplasma gondii MAS]PUA92174.1 hy